MPYEFRSGHYYIEHQDGLTRAVFGRITVGSTAGRLNPPPPLSGFGCDRTPFAKGHIMALELGGPDICANIVPQYGLWQGNGEWRAMEVATAANHNGQFFAAWLYYNFAGKDYAGESARWSGGEVFDWRHEYIPSRIDVCILDAHAEHAAVARFAAALNAQVAGEGAFADALNIIRRLPDAAPVLFHESFYQYEMPYIDRRYWLGQHVFAIVDGWWQDYNRPAAAQAPVLSTGRSRRGAATPAPPPARMDDLTFTYAGATAVKQVLMRQQRHDGRPMWEPAYLNATVTPAFCVESRFGSLTSRQWTQLQRSQSAFPYTPQNPVTS